MKFPPTHLYLIRHGQSDGNAAGRFGGHSPTPLSELGQKQAEITAKFLASEKIDVIYSSDLLRAVQTAEPLSKLIKTPVSVRKAFRERNVGVLEGLTFMESREKYPDDYYALINREIDFVITGGESYIDLLDRAVTELDSIIYKNKGKRIAVFSHTGTICYLTLHLLGAITRYTRTTPWLVTSNCGINRFEIRNKYNIRCHAMNDTRHLINSSEVD